MGDSDEGEVSSDSPPPGGTPSRNPRFPLFEALLFFSAFWLRAYIPVGPFDPSALAAATAKGLSLPSFHAANLLFLLPATALLLYLIASKDGIAAFGIRPLPRSRDLVVGSLLAALALGIAVTPGILVRFIHAGGAAGFLANPLLDAVGRPETSPLLFVPLVLASSIATGYGEELFFRVYLLRRLSQAGFSQALAVIVSSLLFGIAHGSQGLLGIALAFVLGTLFALRFAAGKSWHEIAFGHGMYNFVVLLLVLYR